MNSPSRNPGRLTVLRACNGWSCVVRGAAALARSAGWRSTALPGCAGLPGRCRQPPPAWRCWAGTRLHTRFAAFLYGKVGLGTEARLPGIAAMGQRQVKVVRLLGLVVVQRAAFRPRRLSFRSSSAWPKVALFMASAMISMRFRRATGSVISHAVASSWVLALALPPRRAITASIGRRQVCAAFENQVFQEVGQVVVARGLIAGTHVIPELNGGQLAGVVWPQVDGQTVAQGEVLQCAGAAEATDASPAETLVEGDGRRCHR